MLQQTFEVVAADHHRSLIIFSMPRLAPVALYFARFQDTW
jgi:hypothetical protein